jgi:hypothetical protein
MKTILVLFGTLFIISCSEVLFKSPQPAKAERIIKIPQELWGFYQSASDTIVISEYSIQFRSSMAMVQEINFDLRNEEVILKESNNNYYINLKVEEDDISAWQLARFNKSGKKLDVRYLENLDSINANININDSTDLFNNIEIKEKGEDKVMILDPKDFKVIDKLFDVAKSKIFMKK